MNICLLDFFILYDIISMVMKLKIIKRVLLFFFLIIFLGGSTIIGIGYSIYTKALKETPLTMKIEQIQSDENYTKIEDLPKYYKDAVVSVEDRRFYDHGAIDIRSILRAIVTNTRKMELAEGGSTITQQLAKNLYFIEEKAVFRKVAEIFMAHLIEQNYSKDEILELYTNTCYFGDGYYGIKEASLGYLQKLPSEMNLDESTLLAGVPNAPSAYAPSKNPELARERQEHVLETMVTNHYISQEEADQITP